SCGSGNDIRAPGCQIDGVVLRVGVAAVDRTPQGGNVAVGYLENGWHNAFFEPASREPNVDGRRPTAHLPSSHDSLPDWSAVSRGLPIHRLPPVFSAYF